MEQPIEWNFCPKCGYKIKDEWKFCMNCGQAIPREKQLNISQEVGVIESGSRVTGVKIDRLG